MRRIIGVIVVGVLTAAACGGGDDTSEATATAPSTTAPSADPPATDPPATDPPPPTDPPAADPPATDPPPPTDPPAADPPVVVVSEDGALAIEVSAADVERVNPSIRVLDRSEWPPELAGSDEQSGVVIYELEPDGATFDEPVVVTRAVEVASFGAEVGQFDVPLAVMATQDDDGQFELLSDFEAMRVGDTLLTSATTTHFSPVITTGIDTTVSFPIDMATLTGLPSDGVVEAPGDTLRLLNHTTLDYGTLPVVSPMDLEGVVDLSGTVTVLRGSSGESVAGSRATVAEPQPLLQGGTATGAEAATAVHRIFTEVDLSPTGVAALIEALGISQLPGDVRLKAALVVGSSGDEDIEKQFEALRVMAEEAGFTMEVVHTALGPFPSFSRKRLEVRQLPDGYGMASVTLSGGLLGGSVVDKALMDWEGDAYVAETGLSSYGPVDEAVVVGTDDDVQEFIDDPTDAWPTDWYPRRLDSPMPHGLTIEPFVITAAEEEFFIRRVDRSF